MKAVCPPMSVNRMAACSRSTGSEGMALALREPDAAEEIVEAGVGADGVEEGV